MTFEELLLSFIASLLLAGNKDTPTQSENLSSCKNVTEDGNFTINVGTDNKWPVTIYCHDGKEYLSLCGKNEFFNKDDTGNWPGSGKSIFTKVRINVTTLEIDPRDFTFATSTGKNNISFGVGGGCKFNSYTGYFDIDLTCTPFAIDDSTEWNGTGYLPEHRVRITSNRQKVHGDCGGDCGHCSPKNAIILKRVGKTSCQTVTKEGNITVFLDEKKSQPIVVYCKGGKEYINLVEKNEFFNKDDMPKGSWYLSGRTVFSKVRLDLSTLQIDPEDFTFTTTTGRKNVSFGVGGGCKWLSKTGKFNIDLTGTPFAIDESTEWISFGIYPVIRVKISPDRQKVNGRCGGHCGICQPKNNITLKLLMPPTSCEHATKDGNYTIYVGPNKTQSVVVYCQDKKEYISLSGKNEFINVDDNGNWPDGGKSTFTKVRFQPDNLRIIGNDFTFAETSGKSLVNFGVGGGCKWKTFTGKFDIDLRGTPFAIDDSTKWKAKGFYPQSRVTFTSKRQKVHGICGGHCGHCKPVNDIITLKIIAC